MTGTNELPTHESPVRLPSLTWRTRKIDPHTLRPPGQTNFFFNRMKFSLSLGSRRGKSLGRGWWWPRQRQRQQRARGPEAASLATAHGTARGQIAAALGSRSSSLYASPLAPGARALRDCAGPRRSCPRFTQLAGLRTMGKGMEAGGGGWEDEVCCVLVFPFPLPFSPLVDPVLVMDKPSFPQVLSLLGEVGTVRCVGFGASHVRCIKRTWGIVGFLTPLQGPYDCAHSRRHTQCLPADSGYPQDTF